MLHTFFRGEERLKVGTIPPHEVDGVSPQVHVSTFSLCCLPVHLVGQGAKEAVPIINVDTVYIKLNNVSYTHKQCQPSVVINYHL